MKANDISMIATTACVTAVMALAVFHPGFLEAVGDSPGEKIQIPKLVAGGAEITLTSRANRTYAEGEEPAFDLTARNAGNKPTTVTVEVSMLGLARQPAPDLRNPATLSRVPPMPRILWSERQTLRLNPKETKSMALLTKTKLSAIRLVDVRLRHIDGPESENSAEITALSFATIPLNLSAN
jgi:hypothetical protein